MTQWMNRSDWTSTAPSFNRMLDSARVKGVVFHYPGDGEHTRDGLNAAEVATFLRSYRAYHINTRGWPDIGYCYGVDQAGRIWPLAGPRVAAHSATGAYPEANHERIGILLFLGNNEPPTAAMKAAVRALRAYLAGFFPKCVEETGHARIVGASTRCCGPQAFLCLDRGEFRVGATSRDDERVTIKETWTPAVLPEDINARLTSMGIKPAGRPQDYDAAAVRRYQEGQRYPTLLPDGKWGPQTEAHYQWVLRLQKALVGIKAELVVDGWYGPQTAFSVGRAQEVLGLFKDCKAGPITCARLGIPAPPV